MATTETSKEIAIQQSVFKISPAVSYFYNVIGSAVENSTYSIHINHKNQKLQNCKLHLSQRYIDFQ